jgi:hypothetical protein
VTEYCEFCDEELEADEVAEGVCKKCKKLQEEDDEYEVDEDFIDPGVT